MTKSTNSTPHIILASGSPRRKELCERIGWVPEVLVSDIPEQVQPGEQPVDYTRRLARQKAEDVADAVGDDPARPRLVLAADTIVVLDDRVLEKPADGAEAIEMLSAMSGGWHTVVTSFCWHVRDTGESVVESVETEVRLRELPAAFIENYVATGEPLDKAGAYGIQDFGSLLVRELEGSYFNVVGLPVCEVVESLEEMEALDVHPLLGSATIRTTKR